MTTNKITSKMIPALAAVVFSLTLAAEVVHAQKTLYRYRNDKGILVINDNVPPEFVKNGYDIITTSGTLVDRIAPQKTEAELAEAEAERKRAEEAVRVAEWEKSLMRRYHSIEEIEAARDRVMKEFENQIEILRGNLVSQRSQVETQQQRAADLERRGKPVYQNILDNISALQKEIATTEETIALREKDVEEKRAEFEADIAQFRKIIARQKPKNNR